LLLRTIRHAAATACLAVLLALCAAPAGAQNRRDILWHIVSQCLGREAAADCRAPPKAPLAGLAFKTPAEATAYCRGSSDVWGRKPDQFVAFRDIKMCACPDDRGFIHGLALPYTRVPGVEASNRPDGIWQFAWDVGVEKLGADQGQLALAVNPVSLRSQDQLHVHIVRLRPDYLKRIEEHPRQILRTVRVKDLSRIWHEAPLPAESVFFFRDFGVLVTGDGAGGWIVRLTSPSISPEDEYTVWECPKK
jgi:CDP-diacylglycerol pyrophosphatase